MSALPPAIFLMGPTAAGKTDLALELARALPCELISVDSALVYRGMDIGTAKPAPEVLAEFPHRLIDIRDPAESYSAAEFRTDALRAMAEITARGRIPLLVGGTMLYYKALLGGLADMPGADPAIRAELERQAAEEGLAALHRQLAEVDPESAARIHPNDPQRLVRALEVYRVSGRSMSDFRRRQALENTRGIDAGAGRLPYTVAQFAIAPGQRSVLHERIARRFHLMLELLRGPGEFLGLKQSGILDSKFINFNQDYQILVDTKQFATYLLDNPTKLKDPDYYYLNKIINHN